MKGMLENMHNPAVVVIGVVETRYGKAAMNRDDHQAVTGPNGIQPGRVNPDNAMFL